ncbi:MAG: SH3 domain-containing protein [Chloroflexi bacterium]|nr:SH3 domain-containing protein [Chloroflexota bacterium]
MNSNSLSQRKATSFARWQMLMFALLFMLSACNLHLDQLQPSSSPNDAISQSTQTLTDPGQSQPQTPASPLVSAPLVSVSMDTNCRSGPDKQYDKLGVLLVGEKAEVVGRNTVANYWVIENPDAPGTCWLWGMYATIEGDTTNLPEITPPPTPTSPPPTTVPYTDFTVTFVNLCGGSSSPWANFLVSNTGTLALESQDLHVVDLTASSNLYGPATSDTPFRANTNCDDTTLVDSISAGSTGYSRCKLSSAVPGHTARVTIELCSQNGNTGSCMEKIFAFIIP